MAKARAYCKCRTCGAEFEVTAYKYNRREADSYERWAVAHFTECPACEEKRVKAEREADNARAATAAQEQGYPELIGTDKQITWANTIRETAIRVAQEYLLAPQQLEKDACFRLAFVGAKAILLQMRDAGWWIEHRTIVSIADVCRLIKAINADDCKAVDDAMKAVRRGEMTMEQAETAIQSTTSAVAPEKPVRPEAVPEQLKHAGSVDIRVEGETVTAIYDKDDTFRQIVKGMGFTWREKWALVCGERTGAPDNVAAELGSRLLNAGFAVRFDSLDIMDHAVRGDYVPMCRRWIRMLTTGFFITWAREDDLYQAAKSLPGASYEAPGVKVPERSWAAVADFADRYGFRLTAKAQTRMDELSSAAVTVSPAAAQEPRYEENDVLQSSRDVLPDLRDDDAAAD